MRTLQAAVREPTKELIELEVKRLDGLFMTAFPMAKQGVMGAVDRCLKIMERRARLLGLDAAIKVETSWAREIEQQGASASEVFEAIVGEVMARHGTIGSGDPSTEG